MNRLTPGAALLIGLALAPTAACAGGDKEGQRGSSEGWVSLFDGKTLSGWTMVPMGRGESKWDVVDGLLTGTGQPSMLYSPKGGYKNFRLRAEIKINDGGNSGLYFRVPAKEATFTKGYEAQIDSTHKDPIRTGSIYTMVHVFKRLVPPDTFFTYEIEAADRNYRGKSVTAIKVTVNDELLYEFLDHDHTWEQGYFAFQQHDPGSRVQVRKIEVMELTDSSGK